MIPAAQVSDPAAQLFSLNSQKILRIAEKAWYSLTQRGVTSQLKAFDVTE